MAAQSTDCQDPRRLNTFLQILYSATHSPSCKSQRNTSGLNNAVNTYEHQDQDRVVIMPQEMAAG